MTPLSSMDEDSLQDDMPLRVPVFLDRLTDSADYAVIGPTDGRRRVLNTRMFPFSAVCHVERNFGDGRWGGCTGFLVGPRMVITAGHCITSAVRRRMRQPHVPRQIRVWPGRDGPNAPGGQIPGVAWFAHGNYARTFAADDDVGVVILARDARGPFLELAAPTAQDFGRIRQQRLLHISGYPGDKPRGTQWTHEERLDSFAARRLMYSVDTCPGHSGAPIWVEQWNRRPFCVVGIHVAGPRPHSGGAWGCRPGVPVAPAGHFNRGVRLVPALRTALLRMASTRAAVAPFVRLGP